MDLTDDTLQALRDVGDQHGGLRLLLLHGSRSGRRHHAGSDWDFGYLASGDVDPAGLSAELGRALRTDAIDLVDLVRASALLRFEAARHGRCIYVSTPGVHEEFVLEATLFWCDAEPVIRRAQAAVLAQLTA